MVLPFKTDSLCSKRNGGNHREMFYFLKVGAKSFRDGSPAICKDTESNLGPFAGFQEASFISFLCQMPCGE